MIFFKGTFWAGDGESKTSNYGEKKGSPFWSGGTFKTCVLHGQDNERYCVTEMSTQ